MHCQLAKVIPIFSLNNRRSVLSSGQVLDLLQNVLADERFKAIIDTYMNSDSTTNHLLGFL